MIPNKLPWLEVSDTTVDAVHKDGVADYYQESSLDQNSYLVLRSEQDSQKTALARHQDGKLWRVKPKQKMDPIQVLPKDAQQTALIDSFMNPEILVCCAIGAAGTGKSTLALAYAWHQYMGSKTPRNIFLTKPATYIGSAKAFGPVPGTVGEKYAPFLDSYKIILKKLLGEDQSQYLSMVQEKGGLNFIPIEFARGCTFEGCTVIVDEAQNLTWHELNSIMSRVGVNSKLILLGDLNQIDTKQSMEYTGLYQFINSKTFRKSKISSVVGLTEQYRSPITQLCIETNEELNKKK